MKCKDCLKEMTDSSTESCIFDVLAIDEAEFYYRSRYHFSEPDGRCNDCGIKHGGIHHFGCDVERCPKCGLQLICCGCFDDDAGLFISSELADEDVEIKQPRR